jgi:FkbM family methyltransferase
MKPFRQAVKSLIQRLGYTCRATSSLPVGADLFLDLRRLSLEPRDTIFDVGANVGQTGAALRTVYPKPRIYCFEPSPETFKTLVQNCKGKDIIALNMAVGSSVGTEQMCAEKDSCLNSLVPQLNVSSARTSQVSVAVTTLDRFCEERGVERIDLLKTDTEGYELEVLKGATRLLREKRVRAIYVECAIQATPRHVSVTDLLGFLKDYGFQLHGLYEQSFYTPSPPGPGYRGDPSSSPFFFCNALFVTEVV